MSPLVLCPADNLALVGVLVISEWKKHLGELELYARDKGVNNNLLPRNRVLGYVIMKELWSLKKCANYGRLQEKIKSPLTPLPKDNYCCHEIVLFSTLTEFDSESSSLWMKGM